MTGEERLRYRRTIDRIFAVMGDLSQEAIRPEDAAPHLREIARLCLAQCYYLDLLKEK